jgi:hypothetical protein
MKRGGKSGGHNPWYGKRAGQSFQNQKDKPIFTLPPNLVDEDDEEDGPGLFNANPPPNAGVSFTTDREPGAFIGWKLYFPFKSEFSCSINFARFLNISYHFKNSKILAISFAALK